MPVEIQAGELQQALASFFQIKGRWGILLDEVVVPTLPLYDQKWPWHPGRPCGSSRGAVAQGAGTNAGICVTPDPGQLLRVDQVLICNDSGATAIFSINALHATNFALITQVSSAALFNHRQLPPENFQVPARIRTVNHTSGLGSGAGIIELVDASFGRIDYPGGFLLDGDATGNQFQGLVVWNETQNAAVRATFFGELFTKIP